MSDGDPVLDWGELGVSELPTGTVTLLLADVEGSTRLWQTQPEEMTAALARLDEAITAAVAAHQGVRPMEQGEGDSFVVAFSRASDAVACALSLQRAPLAPIRLRIGVHTGEVQLRGNTAAEGNYVGPTINRTARLRDLAHGGQTVLSGAAEEMVRDQLPDGAWLTDLGSHALRDLPRPERVVQLCHPDLRNDFPSLRAPEVVAVHNLPVQLTRFVGRGAQLADVTRLLAENRLVTLTGAGGAGKTRLAVQVAPQLIGLVPEGVWYVDLAPITHADVVPVAAARALGLPDQPGRSTLDTLTRFIGERPVLVILDNCEHLLDACAVLIVQLLGACPRLRVLTTSREPLGIAGEVTLVVPSLSLADEAIELFIDRARHADPEFVATDDNAAALTEICGRLDGMPLAIELAAARVRALTLDEILHGLQDRFRLLTGGARRSVRRQQTLHASVDWSHALLTDAERVLFRRLAVFLGGFDVAAAHAVAADPGVQRFQVLDQLSLLVDKSLLIAENSSGRTRYRQLETVRQYALEKLAESGEAEEVNARHRDHYTALATDLDAPAETGHTRRLAQAEIDIDNLRGAFAWSLESADPVAALRLAVSLQPLWYSRWRVREGLTWLDAALAADTGAGTDPIRVQALADRGMLLLHIGAIEDARIVDEALALAREIGDPAALIRALVAHGNYYAYDAEVAAADFQEAGRLAREVGDRWRLCQVLAWRVLAGSWVGDHVGIEAAASEGGDLAASIGDDFNARLFRLALGNAALSRGDVGEAVPRLRAVCADAAAAREPFCLGAALVTLAFALAFRGDIEGAQAAMDDVAEDGSDLGELRDLSGYPAIATIRLAAGDAEGARDAFETALRHTPLARATASLYSFVALGPFVCGDLGAARRRADELVAIATGVAMVAALTVRSRIGIVEGRWEQANLDARAALDAAAESRGYVTVADALECLGYLAGDAGRQLDAARLFGMAEAARRQTGVVRFKVLDAEHELRLSAVRDALAEAEFTGGWEEGAALSIEEAIAYVRRGRGDRKRPASGWGSLTPTERDVVRLVADGLSNTDVGAKLFISPRTVQTHLTHVYAKLGLTSRLHLAQEAARHR